MRFTITDGDGTSDAATITFIPEAGTGDAFMPETDGSLSIALYKTEQRALAALLADLSTDTDGSIAGRLYGRG